MDVIGKEYHNHFLLQLRISHQFLLLAKPIQKPDGRRANSIRSVPRDKRGAKKRRKKRRQGGRVSSRKFMVSDTEGVIDGFYTTYYKKLKNVQDI